MFHEISRLRGQSRSIKIGGGNKQPLLDLANTPHDEALALDVSETDCDVDVLYDKIRVTRR